MSIETKLTNLSIDNNETNLNNVLTIKTVQIAPFRILMTALKDILLDTNIVFTKDGIKIINMDKTHTILVHLALKASNFEFYECKHDKIIVGVNMFHLFKLITSIDNDDTLTIYIENDDYIDCQNIHISLINMLILHGWDHLGLMYKEHLHLKTHDFDLATD